jgi:hypothetical protein
MEKNFLRLAMMWVCSFAWLDVGIPVRAYAGTANRSKVVKSGTPAAREAAWQDFVMGGHSDTAGHNDPLRAMISLAAAPAGGTARLCPINREPLLVYPIPTAKQLISECNNKVGKADWKCGKQYSTYDGSRDFR